MLERRRTRRAARGPLTATLALIAGLAVLGALPLSGNAGAPSATAKLEDTTADLVKTVDETARKVVAPVVKIQQDVARAVEDTAAPAPKPAPAPAPEAAAKPAAAAPAEAASPRQETQEPATTPPLHGAQPHGQGSVAVIDLQPSNERPLGDDPAGTNTGEEIVVGRARGEQRPDGTYHGHITIAALFGNEILGVDTGPGETQAGPLDAIQTGVLDAICSGSANNVCVSVARADSQTTESGTTNRFSTARATLGGPQGIDVGAAESSGVAATDGACQTTRGESRVADAKVGGQAVADVAQSSSESKACRGQAPQQTNQSSVIGLGGTGVPLPAAGCADGTPDTVTGIPTLAPIVCNADDSNGGQTTTPYGVREALSVFALATGTDSLLKATTAASESAAKAPPAACSDGKDNDGDGLVDGNDPGCSGPDDDNEGDDPPRQGTEGEGDGENGGPACSDGRDNDGDGLIDARDPGCHTDGNPNNPDSFDPDDTSEGGRPAECADGRDNDGDGRIDAADPGCHTDGNPNNPDSYNPRDDSEAGGGVAGRTTGRVADCADGRDNDGDGVIDEDDPGCHTDGDASNPDSYDPNDPSEGGGAGGRAEALAFTGTNVLGLALSGLVLLAGGLALRRRAIAGS